MRDEHHDDQWQFARLQLTLLSPTIALVELEHNLDAGLDSGIFCLGLSDPWNFAVPRLSTIAPSMGIQFFVLYCLLLSALLVVITVFCFFML